MPGEWVGDEGRFDFVGGHFRNQRTGGPGGQFDLHEGIRAVVAREDGRQAAAGGALQRAQAERADGFPHPDRGFGFVRQLQEAIRISEQHRALSGWSEVFAAALEQRGVEARLQLLNPRRHIGRDAVDFLCGAADATFSYDGAEYFQGSQVNVSHFENHLSILFICSA